MSGVLKNPVVWLILNAFFLVSFVYLFGNWYYLRSAPENKVNNVFGLAILFILINLNCHK